MGGNDYGESGNGNKENFDTLYEFDFFEKKNLNIKKIVCSGICYCFNIFLTGY
jgi:hypothetical protein